MMSPLALEEQDDGTRFKNNVAAWPQAANQAPPPTASLNSPHHYAIVAT